jgi:hypothetical protein
LVTKPDFEAIAALPAAHYNVFLYLTSFLREVIAAETENTNGFREKLCTIYYPLLVSNARLQASYFPRLFCAHQSPSPNDTHEQSPRGK